MSTPRERRDAIIYSLGVVQKKVEALELKKSQQALTSNELQELAAGQKCIRLGKELLNGR